MVFKVVRAAEQQGREVLGEACQEQYRCPEVQGGQEAQGEPGLNLVQPLESIVIATIRVA